jgi:hypothetical protein
MKAEDFTVTVLREIATPLFEMLESDREFEMLDLMGRIESTTASGVLAAMSDVGSSKGDVRERITGAVAAVEKYMYEDRHNRIKTAMSDNEDEYLRRVNESLKMKKA